MYSVFVEFLCNKILPKKENRMDRTHKINDKSPFGNGRSLVCRCGIYIYIYIYMYVYISMCD